MCCLSMNRLHRPWLSPSLVRSLSLFCARKRVRTCLWSDGPRLDVWMLLLPPNCRRVVRFIDVLGGFPARLNPESPFKGNLEVMKIYKW